MRILVTGANGLVGKKLAKQIAASAKHEVIATSLKRIHIDGVQSFSTDLINADVNSLIEQIKPDSVVHCAALSSPDACEVDRFHCQRMNVEMVQRLAAACRDYHVHFVLLSSDFVFDGAKGGYTEEDTPNPILYFGEAKLEAEKLLANMQLAHAVVRTALVFGYETKLSRPNWLLRIVQQTAKGKTVEIAHDRIRSATFAEDLAVGIEAVATNKLEGIYHIAGDKATLFEQFALQIAKTFNIDTSLLKMTPAAQIIEAAHRPFDSSLNTNKAQNELNYRTTPLDEAITIVKSQMFK